MHKIIKYRLVLSCLLLISSLFGIAQNKNINPFPESEYVGRINALLEILDSNSAVVMKSADFVGRSNDVSFEYQQESNFFYMTGLNDPSYYLIVCKNGILINKKACKSVLFVPDTYAQSDQAYYSKIFDTILNSKDFSKYYNPLPAKLKNIYYSSPDIPLFYINWIEDKAVFADARIKQSLKEKYPGLKVRNASTLLTKLRDIKSANEIKIICKSIALTEAGIIRAMKNCKPGVWEYELQADIEYERMKGGGEGQSFSSIIGSGPNSVIIHYDNNNRKTKENDLVVIDVGSKYKGYSSDITRTFPVSGKFTDAQKTIYSILLETQKEIIKFIKPGFTTSQMDSVCKVVYRKYGYEKYFYHGVTHGLGIDVHDGIPDTLKPGMIVTVEPGIYIAVDDMTKPPEFRGMGVRIEDDVLITSDGCTVLTTGVPKEIAEIEKMMNSNK